MTPRTRTELRAIPLRSPQRAVEAFLAAAVVAVFLLAPSLSAGSFVPRLTLDNPTLFDLNVDLAGEEGQKWLEVGTVGRESQSTLEEIADAGSTWVLRFTYGGVEAGEVTVSRADLRADGWELVIPEEFGTRLTDAGFVPSAR